MNTLKSRAQSLLQGTGIEIDGKNPWDPKISDDRFYARVLSQGALGLGESYMDGWWDCEQLDEFFARLLSIDIESKIKPNFSMIVDIVSAHLENRQDKSAARKNSRAHYDLGNDLYAAMLDPRMVYTCAYWKNAKNLAEAQEAKLDLVCRKIGLKPGDKILDIGCGWGSFAKFAAEKYRAQVVGINLSEEQTKLGRELCKGLPVELRVQDYRDVNEKFDHIVSIGMIEAVGPKNFRDYFQVASRCLKDGGLFLLHTIGGKTSMTKGNQWIDKYIFPGGVLPSIKQLAGACEGLFLFEDVHNFGADYDLTLMAWFKNFDAHWNELKLNPKYDERFYRMWKYYLLSCAGGFRARDLQLWQMVLSKNGVPGGYETVR